MKAVFIVFSLLSAVLLAGCSKPEDVQKWTVWLADGKNDMIQVDLSPSKTPLDNYKENMVLIHPWDFGKGHDDNDPTRTKLGTPKVTRIGTWEEYIVYDLTDRANVCKQIMLKDRYGNHRIIYSQLHWCTSGVDDLPYITCIQGISVLAYRTRVPGTGGFFREYYFIYDKKNKKPVLIDLGEIGNSLVTLNTGQTDPSLVPMDQKYKPEYISLERYERYRYVADFNFDGIMDITLSVPVYTFGNGGGWYTLYRGNADGSFSKMDAAFLGGIGSLVKRNAGNGVLCIYSHGGGGGGSLIKYSITSAGVNKISHKELLLGDAGRDCDEYDRIFNEKDVLIRQISKTIDSKVIWANDFPKPMAKSIDELVIEIVAQAKANNQELFRKTLKTLDVEYKDHKQKLIEMILRSDMESNYKQRIKYISSSEARLNYHYLEKGCHFQIELEKEKDWKERSSWWTVKRIYFCR